MTETCDSVLIVGVHACVCVCACVPVFLADGRGGFPKDDPGSREDGRRRAAGENLLLHDVEPAQSTHRTLHWDIPLLEG